MAKKTTKIKKKKIPKSEKVEIKTLSLAEKAELKLQWAEEEKVKGFKNIETLQEQIKKQTNRLYNLEGIIIALRELLGKDKNAIS